MHISVLLLVVAVIVFAFGALATRLWINYYPSFICLGLFFLSLSMLWPELSR